MNIVPTVMPAAAARSPWDAVVIGAGPAGALAARELALGGARTLLVDQHEFPRSKVCGACLNPSALDLLACAGLGPLVAELDGRPLRWFEVHVAGRAVRLDLPGGLAVSRTRLDAALVQAAMEAGAAFLPGTRASLHGHSSFAPPAHRTVELTGSGGPRHSQTIEARIVLAAGGLGQARALPDAEFRSQTAARARVGLGAVLAGSGGCEPGTIVMCVARDGYVGLVRIEGAALNVAAAVDPDCIRRHGGPARAIGALLRESGLASIPDLSSARWSGTLRLTRRTRPVAGERVFLLGDAAGYIEPFTGEGIAWALAAARNVIPLARQAIDRWDPRLARLWESAYRRSIARRQRVCRAVAAGVRHPRMAAWLLTLLSHSHLLAGTLTQRISGSPTRLSEYCS